jgi:hypothetical protein
MLKTTDPIFVIELLMQGCLKEELVKCALLDWGVCKCERNSFLKIPILKDYFFRGVSNGPGKNLYNSSR